MYTAPDDEEGEVEVEGEDEWEEVDDMSGPSERWQGKRMSMWMRLWEQQAKARRKTIVTLVASL